MAMAAATSEESAQSSSSNFRNFSNMITRRLSDSAIQRRGRVIEDEVIALPEIAERTIYVTDEGLIVSTAGTYSVD